jgi:hypothetical protein
VQDAVPAEEERKITLKIEHRSSGLGGFDGLLEPLGFQVVADSCSANTAQPSVLTYNFALASKLHILSISIHIQPDYQLFSSQNCELKQRILLMLLFFSQNRRPSFGHWVYELKIVLAIAASFQNMSLKLRRSSGWKTAIYVKSCLRLKRSS